MWGYYSSVYSYLNFFHTNKLRYSGSHINKVHTPIFSLLPTPCSLFPIPCSLFPVPFPQIVNWKPNHPNPPIDSL
ncbi:MAG: hypothetical protein F6K56_19895 [Moorea sp. SIO3G5]|nr:hypothetical protein [Moorena sp. SIO3G5]